MPAIEPQADEDSVARRRRTEAVMLFHRGPVNLRRLAQLAGLADATEARTLLRQLNTVYDQSGSAVRVDEVAGGYQLLTRPSLAPWLRRFGGAPPAVRLSSPAMETLAIVAYRQPILRADVEAIRGVACGEILRQLMQRNLVRISGRSEDLGRPYLYGTTKHFLQTFGLKDASSLPSLMGAGVENETEDTLAIPTDPNQVTRSTSPIDPTEPSDVIASALPFFDASTQKESDVSTACVLNDLADPMLLDNQGTSDPAFAGSSTTTLAPPRAADDDDDDYFDDDDDDDEDDEEEEDWDDDDEEEDDEAVEDDDAEDEWEEVGDEEEDEVEVKKDDKEDAKEEDEDEKEVEGDDEEEEEEEDWDDDEDEDWDDDDDDDDDDEEKEEEEWD